MEKKQNPVKKAPTEKKADKKKEIPEKELDKVSGGSQVQRDQIRYRRPK